MLVHLTCLDCKHTWVISAEIIMKHGEEVINIDLFDDLCPVCESQGDVKDFSEEFGFAVA